MGFKDTFEKILDKIGENDYKPTQDKIIGSAFNSLEAEFNPFDKSGDMILSLLFSIYFKNFTIYAQNNKTISNRLGCDMAFLDSVSKITQNNNPKDAVGWLALYFDKDLDLHCEMVQPLLAVVPVGLDLSNCKDSFRATAGMIDKELKEIKQRQPDSKFKDLLDCFALVEKKLKDEKMLSPNLVESIRKIKNSFNSVL